jgi:hypothetical protein
MLIEWFLCDYPEFDALPSETKKDIIKAYKKSMWKQYQTWKYLLIVSLTASLYVQIFKDIDPVFHWLMNQRNGFVSLFLGEWYIVIPALTLFFFLYYRNMYKYFGRHLDIIIQGPLTDPALFTRVD